MSTAVTRYTFTARDVAAALHVRRVDLRERLSQPYALTLELLSPDPALDPRALLGAACTLTIAHSPGPSRTVHGVVLRVETLDHDEHLRHLRLEVGPALALLAHRVDTRLWQHTSAPDIIKDVLEDSLLALGRRLRLDLAASYPARETCTQYRESDLEFVQRLLHEEGIAFAFDHDDDAEVLVLLDDTSRCPVLGELPFVPRGAAVAEAESVERLDPARALGVTSLVQRDWHPLAAADAPYERGRLAHDDRGRDRPVYEHDDIRVDRDDGSVRARRKLEQRTLSAEAASGTGTALAFAPARRFDLAGHADGARDRRWLLLEVTHRGEDPDAARLAGAPTEAPKYLNTFTCVPDTTPLRPPHDPSLRRPRVHGPHTAIVVGPEGEEIHTDEHGRIRVRFHWDRSLRRGDDCSCWVPVAQTWAGPGWGALFLPRVGMEVVVQFLDGDPDRPLVVGCVYNSLNTPPLALPTDKTRSILNSESTPGGGLANQIALEDARGRESLSLRTRRDLHTRAGHDHTAAIAHDLTVTVGEDHQTLVGNDQVTTVGNDCHLSVADGNLTTVVQNGSRTTRIHRNDTTVVTVGDSKRDILGGMHELRAHNLVRTTSQTSDVILIADQSISVRAQKKEVLLVAEQAAELTSNTDEVRLRADTCVSAMTTTGHIEALAKTFLRFEAETDVRLWAGKDSSIAAKEHLSMTTRHMFIEGTESITFKCGESSIVLTPQGIVITSPHITGDGIASMTLKSPIIRLN